MESITAEAPSQAETETSSPGPVPFAATVLPLCACAFSILVILAHGADGDGWSVARTAALTAVVSWWVLRGFLVAAIAAGFMTFVATLGGWASLVEAGSNASWSNVGLVVCATGAFVALLVLWHGRYVRWHRANGHPRPTHIATVVLFGAVAGALWGLQSPDAGPYDNQPPPMHGGQSSPAR